VVQLDNLIVHQRLLAATVCAALLGERDPLSLPFADQRSLEFGKCPHDRQHQVRHRRILAGKAQAFLDELDADAALGELLHQAAQVVQVAGQAIHAVHHHRIALARERHHGIELRPMGVLPGRLVNEMPVHLDVIELAFRVLVKTADPDIANTLTVQDVLQEAKVSGKLYDPSRNLSINYELDSILTDRLGLS